MLNKGKSELIGAIIGDGNIRFSEKHNQYYVEITGNKEFEKDYFQYLSGLLSREFKLNSKIRESQRGLRLRVYSKKLVQFLINLGLPYNRNKSQNVFIPTKIVEELELLVSCIKGISDTDGSLFFSRKGNRKYYPSIEISTTSEKLAFQLKEILKDQFDLRIGFRSFKQGSYHRIYRISINGTKMLEKWMNLIGFSNKRILDRYKKFFLGENGGTEGI